MIPTGCPDFEVDLPRPCAAGGSGAQPPSVVKAADFGLSEASTDNAAAINAALAEAKRIGASRVELAPGTYRCFNLGVSAEAQNNPGVSAEAQDQVLRRAGNGAVLISGFTDFTFDGCGATLVFRRDHAPLCSQDTLLENGANITVRGCLRTVVQNFNMDWDWENDPLAVWCRCVGKHIDEADNATYIDLELEAPHPKYPNHVPVQLLTPFSDDRSGWRQDIANGPRYYLGTSLGCIGSKSEWLSPTRLRVWLCVRPDYGYVPEEQAGAYNAHHNREFAERARIGGLYSLSHCYYGLNGFVVDSNEHLTLRDMAVRAHTLDDHVAFTAGPLALARDMRFGDGDIGECVRPEALSDPNGRIPGAIQVRPLSDSFLMSAAIPLSMGAHRVNPRNALPDIVRFSDYASAGNTWDSSSSYRVWLPLERLEPLCPVERASCCGSATS